MLVASHCFISWKSQIYARVYAWVLYVVVNYTWATPITGKSYVWFDPAGVQVAVAFVACRYFIIRINRIENLHLYTYLYGDMIGRQSIVKFWSKQDTLIYSTLFFFAFGSNNAIQFHLFLILLFEVIILYLKFDLK